MANHCGLGARDRGLTGRWPDTEGDRGILTVWRAEVHGAKGHYHRRIVTIGLDEAGERCRRLERRMSELRNLQPSETGQCPESNRLSLAGGILPEMLRRDLAYAGCLPDGASFSARLLAWIEVG